MRLWAVVLILALSQISCVKKDVPTKEDRIAKVLAEKNEKYRQRLLRDCRENTLDEAIMYVDSIVSSELSFSDTLRIPTRPGKPLTPEKIILNDSLKASPIF